MTLFALVDCNNFYASCERVFDPSLENKPIIVLSNNDGCIVARSNEAKLLNLPMAAPYFKYKDIIKKNNVHVFSSNYALYGDLSARVMATLETLCSELEIYSIDEAFLQLDSYLHFDLLDYGKKIKQKVKRWTGIPVSIGIAPTKTLAKIANHIAKKKTKAGVFYFDSPTMIHDVLAQFPIEEIWGIGRQLSQKLWRKNIKTAYDLSRADPKSMRKEFSVVMEKMIYELQGISCISLEEAQPKKQIMSSRSFGKSIINYEQLVEATSYHVTKAAEKARKQMSRASGLYFFLHTNPFSRNKKQYANSMTVHFPEHTYDTTLIMKTALYCLKKLFRAGFEYHKLGIMLLDLIPEDIHQQDLLLSEKQASNTRKESLMHTIDEINQKMGRRSLKFCSEGFNRSWDIQSNFKSLSCTTNDNELHKVYCK